MTNPPDLPPEQEAVRRLLADARHDGPTPPEVVARLDATLASLAAEREPAATTTSATTSVTAPVVDLGARRRRMAGIGLLAASAVVVAGVALGQVVPSMQGGSDAGSTAGGDAAASQRDLSDDSGGGSDSGGAAESEATDPQSLKSGPPAPRKAYPTLSSDDSTLDEELLSLRSKPLAPEASMFTEPEAACDLSGTGRGRRVLAVVDGAVGAVVFRRADGASQQVDLYVCGDPAAVRTLTLPVP